MNPCKTPHSYRYSPTWAKNVLRKLLRNYARATEILGRHSEIDYEKMWQSLAYNDGLYPIMRDCIHYTERYCAKWGEDVAEGAIERYTKHLYSAQPTLLSDWEANGKRFLLTDFREWLRQNSQGIKGGTRGGRMSPPCSSLSPRAIRERYI
jgi:hypothetical protein